MYLRILLLAIVAMGVAACTLPESNPSEQNNKSGLRLYVFDCGWITTTEQSHQFSLGDEYAGQFMELPVRCYLVKHPMGILQWDAGLAESNLLSRLDDEAGIYGPKPHFNQGIAVEYSNSYKKQLQQVGIRPSDVTHIAFSHIHFDHTGNGNLFTEATWLVQEADYQAAFGDAPPPFVDLSTFENLKDGKVELLQGDHDVFGDGTVVLKVAPGHTPGSQVLVLDLPQTGKLLLSGDLWHSRMTRENSWVPKFNVDAEQTRQSMVEINRFIEAEGAELWIQHDLFENLQIALAPTFYD